MKYDILNNNMQIIKTVECDYLKVDGRWAVFFNSDDCIVFLVSMLSQPVIQLSSLTKEIK